MKLISRTMGKQLKVNRLISNPTVIIVQNKLGKDFSPCTKDEVFH